MREGVGAGPRYSRTPTTRRAESLIETIATGEIAGPGSWTNWLLGGGLSEAGTRALLGTCRLVRVRRGQTLLRMEDDRAVLLLEGAAKVHAGMREGDEVITAILGPGDTSGLCVALGHSSAGTDITAIAPTTGLVMMGSALRSLLVTHAELTSACLRTVSRQQARAYEERLLFAGTCISQRVAIRLLGLVERWGRVDGEHVRVMLPLTQEELASWSGASRESVAKVLQLMRATGLIATGRRSLTVLDLARLRERCELPRSSHVRDLMEALASPALLDGVLRPRVSDVPPYAQADHRRHHGPE